jgi:multisubunit Na+/H+ antiporter MnhG subunit
MSTTPPDSKAYRQTVMATLVAAIGGFFLCLATGGYLIVRSDMSRWQVPPSLVTVFILSAVGALLIGAVTGNALNWLHYRRGVYRCVRCNRPRKNDHSPCVCEGIQNVDHDRSSHWPSNFWRQLIVDWKPTLLLALPVFIVAIWFGILRGFKDLGLFAVVMALASIHLAEMCLVTFRRLRELFTK